VDTLLFRLGAVVVYPEEPCGGIGRGGEISPAVHKPVVAEPCQRRRYVPWEAGRAGEFKLASRPGVVEHQFEKGVIERSCGLRAFTVLHIGP